MAILEKALLLPKVPLSHHAFINLKRWAALTGQQVEDALETIIVDYLKHYEFYQQPSEFQTFLAKRNILIYRVLRVAPTNAGMIARKTRIRYQTVKRILEDLELNGVVTRKDYGHVHMFRLNLQSPLTEKILKTLDAWYEPTEAKL
jgi:DNA-binding HxlR family transcriptional regulator